MGIRDQHLFVEDIAAVDLDGDRLTVRWIKGGRSRFRRIVLRKARAMSASLTGIPALCALFVVLWSSGFAGAKYGLDYAGTFTILFWRYLLVATVLALLVTLTRQWRRFAPRDLVRHMTVGVLAHAGWLAAVLGAIDLGLSAGLAAFITALQPIMTGALSARMTGERVTGREWAGLVLGLVAVAIVIGDGIALGGSPTHCPSWPSSRSRSPR